MPDVKALTQAPLQECACEMRLDRDRNLLAKPFERPLNLAQLPLDLTCGGVSAPVRSTLSVPRASPPGPRTDTG